MIFTIWLCVILKIETGKKTLILHGMKTSAVLNAVLSDIYHLKKESAVKFSRRNKDVCPFENGGETSLEFFSHQTDCSLFVVSTKPTQLFASPAILFAFRPGHGLYMHIIYVVQVFLFGVVKDDQSSIVLQALLLL